MWFAMPRKRDLVWMLVQSAGRSAWALRGWAAVFLAGGLLGWVLRAP